MSEVSERELLAAQEWRTETPGHEGWPRSVRPDDPNKLYVISADTHAIEPKDWMDGYIEDSVRERLRERRGRRDTEMDHRAPTDHGPGAGRGRRQLRGPLLCDQHRAVGTPVCLRYL